MQLVALPNVVEQARETHAALGKLLLHNRDGEVVVRVPEVEAALDDVA